MNAPQPPRAPDRLGPPYGLGRGTDHRAEMLGRWAAASELVRTRAHCTLGLRYGDSDAQMLDVFAPDPVFSGGAAPVLVVLHGGGWHALDRSHISFLAASFADEGALVVVPGFDQRPAVTVDRMAMQLTEALAWVWRHAASHGGDPNRIVLLGHDSGAHLAAMMCACDWKRVGHDLPRRLVHGAVAVSGLYDLGPLSRSAPWRAHLGLNAASVRRWSPVHFPAPAAPTTVVALTGEHEPPERQWQAQRLQRTWGQRAVPVCEAIPGCDGFTVLHDLADPESRSHRLTRQLLGLRWYSGLA